MKQLITAIIFLQLSCCGDIDTRESMEEKQLIVKYPPGEFKDNGPTWQGLPVKDCWELYNIGKSIEWQECMGVEPK